MNVFCRNNIDKREGEGNKEWRAWLGAFPRRAAEQEMSKWLREEGDTEWEDMSGRENNKPRYMGGKFKKKDKEDIDRIDFRNTEYDKSTNFIIMSNQQGPSEILRNLLISNIENEGQKRSGT